MRKLFIFFFTLIGFNLFAQEIQEIWVPDSLIHKDVGQISKDLDFKMEFNNPCNDTIEVLIDFDNLDVPDRYSVVASDGQIHMFYQIGNCNLYPAQNCQSGFVLVDGTGINPATKPNDFQLSYSNIFGCGRIVFRTTSDYAIFTTHPNQNIGTAFYVKYKTHLIGASTVTVSATVPSYCITPDTLLEGLCVDTLVKYIPIIDTIRAVGELDTFGMHLEYPFADTALVFDGCKRIYFFLLSPRSPKIYVPNAFSPNNDKINDLFEAYNIPEYEFNIYDRWGNHLFRGTQWDGTFRGKPLDTGVYVWYLRGFSYSGNYVLMKGEVNLIK